MPVEAVRFGHEEEMVVAGSISGALKVWDLEQAKSKKRNKLLRDLGLYVSLYVFC